MPDEMDPESASPDPVEAEFPPILRLTNARVTSQEALDDLGQLGEHLRASDPTPEARYAVPVEDLLSVFTPERIRLVESLLEEPAGSVGALARRVGRPERAVADDLRVLADGYVVSLRDVDGETRPLVPFEKVTIEIDLVSDAGED